MVLLAIIGLGVIILFHELGHFLAGKLLGIKVEEFMLGLPGPVLFSFKRGETKYGVTAILFGGYVRFAGRESELGLELSEEPSEAETAVETQAPGETGAGTGTTDGGSVTNAPDPDAARTFDIQPIWKKGLVTLAGPVMNLILPVLVVAFVLTAKGSPVPTTTVESVVENSPAKRVGIEAGDRIVGIKGTSVRTWQQLISIIRANPNAQVEVQVERRGERLTFSPTLTVRESNGFLGIETRVGFKRETLPLALYHGVVGSYQITVFTVQTLYVFLTQRAGELVREGRGPVGIVYETAQIARRSIWEFFSVLAFLSVNVGIINLFPIPPLDGGRLAIYGIEGLTRRRINRRVVFAINAAGMALLLLLMFYLVVADFGRILFPTAGG